MRVALTIEYDGTAYSGFQYQKYTRTIQEEIENAIHRFSGERVRINSAGRTDAGVHAKGQVIAFDTMSTEETSSLIRGLNFYLPDDISVKCGRKTSPDFDPRRWATGRRYIYSIERDSTRSPLNRRTVYRVAQQLDLYSMSRASKEFEGIHDFARFAGPLEDLRASTVREIFSTEVRTLGEIIEIEIYGNAFLPHQVRRMSGALVDVGRGKLPLETFSDLIDGNPTDAVAHSLPAHGLCLVEVTYKQF